MIETYLRYDARPATRLAQGHLTGLDVLQLLALIGGQVGIVGDLLRQSLVHAGELGLIRIVSDLRV